jgi:hypothetical protein
VYVRRVRMSWAQRLTELTEEGFYIRYRMSKASFAELVELLKQYDGKARTSRLSVELRLS